jgi:branched-chain amino acid transport system substrate-binding protein
MRRARSLLPRLVVVFLLTAAASAAAAEDVVTLGAAMSMTGKYALNCTNTKNGYDLAIRKINEKGGIASAARATSSP